MKRDARFYFANLGVDVGRCVSALQKGDQERYSEHLKEAHRTLEFLHSAPEKSAYQEGLLLLQGLEYAREDEALARFSDGLNDLIAEYSPLAQ